MKIVIVGAGEVGFQIAGRLARENKEVVVIDKDPDAIRRLSEIDVQALAGSGGSPVVLEEAGIMDAEILLAVTDSDEINLVACLMADIMSPSTKKLARIRDADYDTFHERMKANPPHIDTVINPEIEVINTIDRFMSVPGAVDIAEFAGGKIKLVGIRLDKDAGLAGVRLIQLPEKLGDKKPLIAAIVRNENLIIPTGDDVLEAGDTVYFVSEESKLSETLNIFGKSEDPVRYALIVGGGRTGIRLASFLEKKGIHTKIIEKIPERCDELADKLDRAVVLCGDGTDQTLLEEENAGEMDYVITVTDQEETNILASLLAKRLGAKKAVTKISKFGYIPLMPAVGIEKVVNPRLSAINTILRHIRKGKILSAISIKGEKAEVLEAEALETSDIVGKPIMDVGFPKGGLIAGILRDGEVIIPTGMSIIQPGDRIVIFALRDAIPKIEEFLTVKLEFF